MNQSVVNVQNGLKTAGFYTGKVDGVWGPMSSKAWDDFTAAQPANKVCWGGKVSKEFLDKVVTITHLLKTPDRCVNDFMACMAFESAHTFSSNVLNAAGSGAVGLIQFMPKTAEGLGTSIDSLYKMRPEDQLDYVYQYFKPYAGRLKNLGDIYMTILWPAGIGKGDDFVLWNKQTMPKTFGQNSGLDLNANGEITRGEALAKIRETYLLGMKYSS